ncbi:hypothetical protein D3C78_1804210 [compost metagenome]
MIQSPVLEKLGRASEALVAPTATTFRSRLQAAGKRVRRAASLPMGATVVTLKVSANSTAPLTAGSSITEVTEMLITEARLRTA